MDTDKVFRLNDKEFDEYINKCSKEKLITHLCFAYGYITQSRKN